MVKKSVLNYVRDLMQKGYDTSTIRNTMLRYGYSDKDISDAINAAYSPTIRHEVHFSKTVIVVIAFLSISMITAAYFFFYANPKAPSALLDVNLEPVTTTAKPGESIIFVKELSNLGSLKRYDAVIKQEILDSKTFKVLTEKTETRAIETFGATQTRILIPADAKPGDYMLRVIVEYENKKAVANLPVKVEAGGAATCSDNIKNQNEEGIDCGGICKSCAANLECDDKDACTRDVIENNVCVSKPIRPCCGNEICEEGEKSVCSKDCPKEPVIVSPENIDEIKELARTDPSKALELCNRVEVPDLKDTCIANIGEVQANKNYCTKIENARIKDLCYSNIAEALNDNSVCDEISADSRRDSCYMTFVLDNKDYSVCGRITNEQLRQSCESLKQLYDLNNQ